MQVEIIVVLIHPHWHETLIEISSEEVILLNITQFYDPYLVEKERVGIELWWSRARPVFGLLYLLVVMLLLVLVALVDRVLVAQRPLVLIDWIHEVCGLLRLVH